MVRTLGITTAFLCGIGGMMLVPNLASTASETWGDQALQLADGTKINAIFDEKTRSFTALIAPSKDTLKDGTYKLTNGGAIRVKNGVIVWDAFGVIEKLQKGQELASGPSGLG